MGVRLSGVIDEASQPELGAWGQLIVAWDDAEARPSWMEGFENEDVTFSIDNGFDRGWLYFQGPIWGIGGQPGEWVLVPEPATHQLVLASVLCVVLQGWRRRNVSLSTTRCI
ncbi:hypothetical protein ACFL2H_08985 [Planctomycetota bacterium]